MRRNSPICLVLAAFWCAVGASAPEAIVNLRAEAMAAREQAYLLQVEGDLERAMTLYQKAVALDPTYTTAYNDLGVVYEAKGWYPRAEEAYQRALEFDPTYLQAHTNLALLYEKLGQRAKAIHHWQQRYTLGIQAHPDDPWVAQAAQRLEVLGAPVTWSPDLHEAKQYRLMEQQFKRQDQSLAEFEELTNRQGTWEKRPYRRFGSEPNP